MRVEFETNLKHIDDRKYCEIINNVRAFSMTRQHLHVRIKDLKALLRRIVHLIRLKFVFSHHEHGTVHSPLR